MAVEGSVGTNATAPRVSFTLPGPEIALFLGFVAIWSVYFTISEAPASDPQRHGGSLCVGPRVPARL